MSDGDKVLFVWLAFSAAAAIWFVAARLLRRRNRKP